MAGSPSPQNNPIDVRKGPLIISIPGRPLGRTAGQHNEQVRPGLPKQRRERRRSKGLVNMQAKPTIVRSYAGMRSAHSAR
jgi:hypothetical protein